MAKDASFDIVSEFDHQELVNALDQTRREIASRFDLKDSGSELELEEGKKIVLTTTDEFRAQNIYDILEAKLVKRGLNPLILDKEEPEAALGGKVRQVINLKKGIETEMAKKIVAHIKEVKLKVQASIQGDQVRVSGKNKDDLQEAIQHVREFGDRQSMPLQFTNYR
ncbi:YajQ family cyclic di-GMP-binding protein [Vampirovibrio sp.]|uniref:YajQ family cyclic di-GMP-binding protein n=1 Tax=Vampirovibrio sp. TaxID=2717857 RepID=UPI003593A74E